MQRHAARAIVIDLEPALFHNAARTRVELFQRRADAVSGQMVTLARLHQGCRLLRRVSQVGDRAKSIFTVVAGTRIQQHITPRHALLHLDHFFALDVQCFCHRGNLALGQRIAMRRHIGIVLEALLHRAQIEEKLALSLGGGHLHHAPVFQDVFVNLGLDPVHGITHQAHTLVGVEALDCLHQTDVAFLDQITVRQAIAQILSGN